MKVKGKYFFFFKQLRLNNELGMKEEDIIKEREKGFQYVVETELGSSEEYRLASKDKDGQPVSIDTEAEAEVIGVLTKLISITDKGMIVSGLGSPGKTKVQEIWDRYNLWPYFLFITNRQQAKPKPKPKPKKKPKPTRISSTLAGAIRTAVTNKEETGGIIETSQTALPLDTQRLLLALAQHIPANACTYGPDLFAPWQHIGIRQNVLNAIARNIYGKSGPEQLQKLLQSFLRAAATSVIRVHMVENRENKKGKLRRGKLSITSGSFIGVHDLPYHQDEQGSFIYDVPDVMDISLNNVFGYWLTRFYGVADIQAIIDRSRKKYGHEYMAIRLWGIEISPRIAAATKEAAHIEVFRLTDLQQTPGSSYTFDDRRTRCLAVAAEAAKDMGATYIGPERRKVNGGEAITGMKFKWEKSLQAIEGNTSEAKT